MNTIVVFLSFQLDISFFSCLNVLERSPSTMLNRSGESRGPLLVPDFRRNSSAFHHSSWYMLWGFCRWPSVWGSTSLFFFTFVFIISWIFKIFFFCVHMGEHGMVFVSILSIWCISIFWMLNQLYIPGLIFVYMLNSVCYILWKIFASTFTGNIHLWFVYFSCDVLVWFGVLGL